jgi:hypothetical protein
LTHLDSISNRIDDFNDSAAGKRAVVPLHQEKYFIELSGEGYIRLEITPRGLFGRLYCKMPPAPARSRGDEREAL